MTVWVVQVVVALAVATTWHLAARRAGLPPRGPLEALAAEASRTASGRQ